MVHRHAAPFQTSTATAVLFELSYTRATAPLLTYRPLCWPYRLHDEVGFESWDPECAHPRRREHFGNDGHGDVACSAAQTVPRDSAFRAAVAHFQTGRLPECVRWRKIREPPGCGAFAARPRSPAGQAPA